MPSFVTYCRLHHQIELTPYKTQKEGLDAFSQNPSYWDGIILDAKVLDESENESADIKSLYKAVARIQAEFKDVPFFISTGQPDFMSAELFNAYCQSTSCGRYYKKVYDDQQLCEDIKKAVDEKFQRQIKNKYSEIFSWLPAELYGELLELLIMVETEDNKNTNVFNNVRKVLDWIMTELNAFGILGIKFNGSNLNDCSRFLCSDELKEFVPQYMQRQVHSCCAIANEGSHRLTTDEDVRTGVAPFLVRSTVFELLNILMWVHQLIQNEYVRARIVDIATKCAARYVNEDSSNSEEPMEPQLDKEFNVWHCGDTMISIRFWEGGKIVLLDKQNNTTTNPAIKERYPYFAKYRKI